MKTLTYQKFLTPEECEDVLTNGLDAYLGKIERMMIASNGYSFNLLLGPATVLVSDGPWQAGEGSLTCVIQLSRPATYVPPCDCPRDIGTAVLTRSVDGMAVDGAFVVGWM